MKLAKSVIAASILVIAACGTQDIPQAHKGRMFAKTGVLAFYSGSTGFSGPVLGPGTYYTGLYNELRILDCSTRTIKEPLSSMTKDGVQFTVDIYVSFSANCDEEASAQSLLASLSPEGPQPKPADSASPANAVIEVQYPSITITSNQVYYTFIRPAIGEAARSAISNYNANDINAHRDELFKAIVEKLNLDLNKDNKHFVKINGINLSNFKLPDEMANAAADRATQQVLKDKSLAEQERIKVETETAKLTVAKTKAEADSEAAKIDTIGAALHRNPEYYIRDIYFYAANKGGSVMLPGDPKAILALTPKMGDASK